MRICPLRGAQSLHRVRDRLALLVPVGLQSTTGTRLGFPVTDSVGVGLVRLAADCGAGRGAIAWRKQQMSAGGHVDERHIITRGARLDITSGLQVTASIVGPELTSASVTANGDSGWRPSALRDRFWTCLV